MLIDPKKFFAKVFFLCLISIVFVIFYAHFFGFLGVHIHPVKKYYTVFCEDDTGEKYISLNFVAMPDGEGRILVAKPINFMLIVLIGASAIISFVVLFGFMLVNLIPFLEKIIDFFTFLWIMCYLSRLFHRNCRLGITGPIEK